jgi:hypothetical protein
MCATMAKLRMFLIGPLVMGRGIASGARGGKIALRLTA